MRKYLVHTVLGALLLAVIGMPLLMAPIVSSPIGVSVKIKPETLNLKKNGVITASIEFLNSSYNVSDIVFESIKLRVESASDGVKPISCDVDEGKLIVRFDALSVTDYILNKLVHMQTVPPPQNKLSMDLWVEGIVEREVGEYFEGFDQIKIMLP